MLKQIIKKLIFILFVLILLSGCAEHSSTESSSKDRKKKDGSGSVKESDPGKTACLSAMDVKRKIDLREIFYLVDIRPFDMYEKAHIIGAISMPYDEITARYREFGDMSRETVLYCQTDKTCELASELFVRLGFSDIKIISGGILQWKYALVIDNSTGQWI